MSTPILSLAQLQEKVAAFKAASVPVPADPTENTNVAVPSTAADTEPKKLNTPPGQQSNSTDGGKQGDAIVTSATTPAGVLQGNAVSTENGTAADAAMTTALGKSANLLEKMKQAAATAKGEPVKAAAASTPAAAATPAATSTPELTDEEAVKAATALFARIGEFMYASESGKQAIEFELTKAAGMEKAATMLSDAAIAASVYEQLGAEQYAEQVKQASAIAYQQQEQERLAQHILNLPVEKQNQLVKLAHIQQHDLSQPGMTQDDGYWYAKGAAAMEAMPPEAAPGPDGAAAPGGEPQMPGSGEMPTMEQLAQLLQELVQSGQITPEQAEQLAQQLMQEGGGGDPAAAGGMPPGAEDPAAKEASVKFLTAVGAV